MKLKIGNKASRMISRVSLSIKKHSPEILMVAGIAGTVTSTIMACKATGKVTDIVEEARATASVIRDGIETGRINDKECSVEDGQKAITVLYMQTGVKVLKEYAPALIIGGLSITSIVAGHKILKKRNLALAAAYAVVDKGFKEYRKNVVDRFGEDVDKELRHGLKSKVIDVETVDENGNKVIKQEVVTEMESNLGSDYSKIFDATCINHTKDAEANRMFLTRQQDWANERLKSQGYLFLNDVYDMLDFPRTQAGQVVGWIYDPNRPKEEGDNYIDFGLFRPRNARFINGYEYNVILDFNVDGVIYDLFWKKAGGIV